MFSEGVLSLIDTANQILLLYGIKKSGKPDVDELHRIGVGYSV